jgi:hypothetical protein
MAIPASGPISFGDLNDEIGNPTTSPLDLIQAGLDFGFTPGSPTLGGNWTDGAAGLSMSEFYNGVAGGKSLNADFTAIGPGYTLTSQGSTPVAPGDTNETFLITQPGATASTLTSGPHSIPITVTADGTYVINTGPYQDPSSFAPTSGGTGGTPTVTPFTITVPALPALIQGLPNVPAPLQPFATPSGLYRATHTIADSLITPTNPTAFTLETVQVYTQYNNKDLAKTEVTVPYQAGTFKVADIDWKFGTTFSLSTSAPANPLPNTDTGFVTNQATGTGGTQPSTSNFFRREVNVTVTQNPSPTTARTTYIYAFVPSSYIGTPWYNEMNTGTNPSNPTGFYYPITVTQPASPAGANALTVTPGTATFTYAGGPAPFSIDVTPDSNPYTYALTPAPEAPNYTIGSLSSPQTGDDTFTITATPYSGANPRTATLTFTHPGGTTALPITQTGISLQADGYFAPTTTPVNPVPFDGETRSFPIVTTAPPNTPWTITSDQPFVTIPAPSASGTGPSPTAAYVVAANPTFDTRTANVTANFNVSGTPYTVIQPVSQVGIPYSPEITISPVNTTLTFNGVAPLTTHIIDVDTNVPFTVAFTGDTPYWNANPSTTSFTRPNPLTAPSPTPFTFTTPSANDDYAFRNATFTITSPVAPGTFVRNLVMNRNPSNAFLNFRWPPVGTVTGWSYTSTPAPEGGRLTMPGAGGPASLQVDAHPNLNWSLSVQHPYPGVPAIPNANPIGPTAPVSNVTGPKTWTLPSIPAGPPTGQYSYKFTLADNAPDVVLDGTSTSRQVGMYISTSTPAPVPTPTPTLGISPVGPISVPSAGGPYTINATGDAPFSKTASPSPWIGPISPAPSQTAPASFTVTIATNEGPTPAPSRSGYITVTSPAPEAPFTVTFDQDAYTAPVPTPTPTPGPCEGITIYRSSTSDTVACSFLKSGTQYFNNSSLADATIFYGFSSDCSAQETGTWWVSDSGTYNKFVNGVSVETGLCSL